MSGKNDAFSVEQQAALRAVLTRLFEQPQFVASPAMREMLRLAVETTLDGEAESLKAYTIATRALGRPASFDPQSDPIVRVTATRLRRALDAYAQGPGLADPVTISLGRGSYVPLFAWRSGAPAADEPASPDPPVESRRKWPAATTPARAALAAGVAIAILAATWAFWPAGRASLPADFALAPGRVKTEAPLPVLESRPTLIVGRLEILDSDPATQAQGRRLRARIINELRPFDDLLDVKDDPDYSPERDGPKAGVLTYLVEASRSVVSGKLVQTSNLTHVATGVSIYTTVLERGSQEDSDESRMAAGARDYAVHVAQPYGVISSHVWRTIARSPAARTVYSCQLLVFQYWQTYTKEAFDDAWNCVRALVVAAPNSAPAHANIAFLYVEAVRARYSLPGREFATREQLLDLALKSGNRAVQIAPDSARAHSALSAAYMINRDSPVAVASAREALKLNPNDPELRGDMGAKLVQTGSWREGLDLLLPVIELGGAQPPWRLVFAALGAYMLDDLATLGRLAPMLKKDGGLLSATIQVLDCLARDDRLGLQERLPALKALAPAGNEEVVSQLSNRIYNPDILRRISKDLRRST